MGKLLGMCSAAKSPITVYCSGGLPEVAGRSESVCGVGARGRQKRESSLNTPTWTLTSRSREARSAQILNR